MIARTRWPEPIASRDPMQAPRWVCVGLTHHSAPLRVRERLALTEAQRLHLLEEGVRRSYETLVVATCNRVEVYVASPDAAGARAWVREELGRIGGPDVLGSLQEREGTEALEHLFRVASSLDSLVLGEAQILGQLKAAFEQARRAGAARGALTRACSGAFACAKRVRTETAIGRSATSLASATVAMATQALGSLTDKTVLVVGAGEMGGLAARHLAQAKVGRLLITNRTAARAGLLASRVGGTARPFEALHALVGEADVVVCSTASSQPLLTPESLREGLEARGGRPLLLVDLAVPRDIAPEVARLEGVRVRDVDDLQRFVARNEAARAGEAQKAQVLVRQEVERYLKDQAVREGVPVLARMRQRAERIARAEVERTLAGMGELTDAQRRRIESMGHAIINKLMHEPTSCLRAEAQGAEGQALSSAAARLFGLGSDLS